MEIGEYRVGSDRYNVTLYEKGVSKISGNVYWRPIAYFSSIKNALKHMVDLGVAEIGLKDLRAVVKKQDDLYKLITGLKQS